MVFWGFLSSKLWCFWLTNFFYNVWSWGKLKCRACLQTSSAVKWRLIYYDFKRKLCFQWKNLGSIKSSFYMSLSVFCFLVGLFLSRLKTERNVSLSQSNSNCIISNENVICIVEDTLLTCYFSGLADRAANLPPITFVSPCAFPPQMPECCWAIADPWHWGCTKQEDCSEPLPMPWGRQMPSVVKPSRGVEQVREKCWERGSILILY